MAHASGTVRPTCLGCGITHKNIDSERVEYFLVNIFKLFYQMFSLQPVAYTKLDIYLDNSTIPG